jgi:hypothetical protein
MQSFNKINRIFQIYLLILFLWNPTLYLYSQTAKISSAKIDYTNFAASFNETVLFGNSEDSSENHPLYENPDGTVIWFLSNSTDGFGMMQIGWYWQETHISYQGGINEYCLCYDSTAIPDIDLNNHPEKPYNRQSNYLWSDILRKCKNVSDAISYISQYNFETMGFQPFLTDTNGNSVIISPNFEGELSFTYQGINNGFLVQTNFNRIHPESHYGSYPCSRYEKAKRMLSKIENEENLTMEYFKSILDAVHQTSIEAYTPYSNIFNPKTKMVYLFYASQFYEIVELNLTHELSLGSHEYRLCDLVTGQTHSNGLVYHQDLLFKSQLFLGLVIGGIIAIPILSGIGINVIIRKKRKKKSIEAV